MRKLLTWVIAIGLGLSGLACVNSREWGGRSSESGSGTTHSHARHTH